MVKFLMAGVFTCLEYIVVVLFIASLAFMLAQGLDRIVPKADDYSAQQEELADIVKEGSDSNQITHLQGLEILKMNRDDQAGLRRRRAYILYACSTCVSAAVMLFLFRKYRLLRFRERFRDYLFQPPKS